MSAEERKGKFEKLFDHVWGVAMQQNGSENLMKYTDALRNINWTINEFEMDNRVCSDDAPPAREEAANG